MRSDPDPVNEPKPQVTAPTAVDVDERPAVPVADPTPPARPRRIVTVVPYAVYAAFAVYLLWPLLRDPHRYLLAENYQDNVFFEWVLTHAAHALAHGHDPLFTDLANAPDGINLLGNTSVLAYAVPVAPLTLLAGAPVTFALLEVLGLAGTASAWYFVLGRLLRHRGAAAVGGLFCGFAPALVSQSASHPHLSGQYVLPFIVLLVLRLRAPGPANAVVHGLRLAGLVVVQAFLNEELLFLTALALGLFIAAYAMSRPREVRSAGTHAWKALATTAVTAGAALAYPLYRQFFGPGSYHGLPAFTLTYGADLESYWAFARRSLAGNMVEAARYTQGASEENTFFGWPLVLVVIAAVCWLVRHPVGRALAVTGAVFAVMSLGPVIVRAGHHTPHAGPWRLLNHLPLFDEVVPTRLGLVVTAVVGCLLAVLVKDLAGRRLPVRVVGFAVLAAALVPITPTPLPVFERPAVPAFFTSGTYRAYLPPGSILMTVPSGWEPNLETMQWQTATNLDFRTQAGYFLARDPNDPEHRATYFPSWPLMWSFLDPVAQSGTAAVPNDIQRTQVVADLRARKVTLLVLAADRPYTPAVHDTVAQILGPGELTGGLWVWRV